MERLKPAIKPILFNTEMVRAILEGRKTQTRRIVQQKYDNTHLEMFTNKYGTRLVELQNEEEGVTIIHNPDGSTTHHLLAMIEKEPPYRRGEILWVRETWNVNNLRETETGKFEAGFIYAADEDANDGFRWAEVSSEKYQKYEDGISVYFSGWRPSIHMPKEAARIFLRVKDVRAERLRSISSSDAMDEGFSDWNDLVRVWNKTVVKGANHRLYNWEANPWVWVITFERCERPEGFP